MLKLFALISSFLSTRPVLISEKAERLLEDPEKSASLMRAIHKLKKSNPFDEDGEEKDLGQVQTDNIVVRIVGKGFPRKNQ